MQRLEVIAYVAAIVAAFVVAYIIMFGNGPG